MTEKKYLQKNKTMGMGKPNKTKAQNTTKKKKRKENFFNHLKKKITQLFLLIFSPPPLYFLFSLYVYRTHTHISLVVRN